MYVNTQTRTLFIETFEAEFKLTPLQQIAEFRSLSATEIDELRKEVNDWAVDYANNANNEEVGTPQEFWDEYTEWKQQVKESLYTYQQTITEKFDNNNRDDWYEPDNNTTFYRNFRRDSYGQGTTADTSPRFAVSGNLVVEEPLSSRERYDQTDKNAKNPLIILTEYGWYDVKVTNKSQKLWLNLKETVRKNVPYLNIGPVMINRTNGHVSCGVNGCEFNGRLRYNTTEIDTELDREYAEYQVMKLIEHLGSHRAKNNPYIRILDVKRYRDVR